MTQTIVLCRLVGTVEVTFNLIAELEVDGSQLRQGRQAREVPCSYKARMHKCLHGQLSQNVVVALRQQPTDPDHSQHNPLTWALGGFTGDVYISAHRSTHVHLLEIRQALEHGNVTCRAQRSRGKKP